MKTLKRMLSGLLTLMLLASLTGGALAAETKKDAPKPAGQFSQWFPRMGIDSNPPKASEAVLAKMGTVIQQTKKANGVTATLNAAVWDGKDLRLSLVVTAPNIPKEVTGETNLYTEECSLTMPEKDWRAYVRKDEESHSTGMGISKELLEQSIQRLLDMKQADYWNHINLLNFPLVSREKNTLTFEVWMSLTDYVKKPELTLHLENIATYEDGKGDRVTWQDGKRTGPGPKDTILKGPMDFTFKLENIVPAMEYTGDVKVTEKDVPFRFTKFEIGALDVNFDYEVLVPIDWSRPDEEKKDPDKLSNMEVSSALHGIVRGLWTKDGKFLDLSQRGGGMGMTTSQEGIAGGDVGCTYPHPIDPSAVTAVKLGETRVELSTLKRITE